MSTSGRTAVALSVIGELLDRLNEDGVRYCHWKSNWQLEETLAGETDVDLLIHRRDADPFRRHLHELGFRPAIEAGVDPFPSLEHYHALDEQSDEIAHVHAYYRTISGGSLTKNHRFPFEEMLLGNVRRVGPVNIPSAGAELIVFTLRMLLKHTSVPELLLVRRNWKKIRREADWLITDASRAEADELLRTWLPAFDPRLFARGVAALGDPASAARRIRLGFRFRSELRQFQRQSRLRASLTGLGKLVERSLVRVRGGRKGLTPGGGGAVIAFVGSEATGKSTLIEEIGRWLGEQFTVELVHAGKPPSTIATAMPNVLLPLLRSLLPGKRSTRVSLERAAEDGHGKRPPLLFALRAVMLGADRRSLLTRAFSRSANGVIVLCDRYPSAEAGALDSVQLGPEAMATGGPLIRRLARLEERLYARIPPPDLVIYLSAPLEITLERNRARHKTEDEDYVRKRYELSSNLRFERTHVHRVDTDRSFEDATREVKRVIWAAL